VHVCGHEYKQQEDKNTFWEMNIHNVIIGIIYKMVCFLHIHDMAINPMLTLSESVRRLM
jgi:hypothetical protein